MGCGRRYLLHLEAAVESDPHYEVHSVGPGAKRHDRALNDLELLVTQEPEHSDAPSLDMP